MLTLKAPIPQNGQNGQRPKRKNFEKFVKEVDREQESFGVK